MLNPAHLFQLLPGVLTGSIENLGEEEVAGVPTTHFRANFDAKRATEDARQERRESIDTALELMSVTKRDAIKGDVWIDAEGVPRKVRMELRQKFTRRDIISVNVAAVLEQVRTEGEVTVPARDQAARTDELGAIARGLQGILSQLASQLGGATAGAGQPGAPPTDVPPTDAPATDAPAPASGTAP
jgi:RNA-binding protein YhbY